MKQVWKGVVGSALAVIMLLNVGAKAEADSSNSSRPTTIPALREWTGSSGSFQIGKHPYVLIHPSDESRLRSDAEVFADDLETLTGKKVKIKVTKKDPDPGDILLELGSQDTQIGDEGYKLTVGSSVNIKATTSAGAFYGTRTLLQLLKQSPSVPAGAARDWPRYPERGLMMDIARRNISYNWLAARVREMAYLKLNYLHLHFTDDQGWRIESGQGLQSPQFLTKDQIRKLVTLAASYHITVVPEIDMPGHMGWALKNHPEFQLKDQNGVAVPNKIDYTIPAAREFLHNLIEEYLPLFPGKYWHVGADEFLGDSEYQNYPQLEQYAKQTYGPLATAKDGVHGLINEINGLVRAKGKTLRIWNDSTTPDHTIPIDKNVVIDWWTDLNTPYPSPTNPVSPQQLLLEGYTIQNSGFWPTYDFPDYGYTPVPSIQHMYEDWAVNLFHGFAYNYQDGSSGTLTPLYDVGAAEPRNLGSSLNFWNDVNGLTEEQVAASIFPRLRVMAQKTWESAPLVTTYADFQSIIQSVGSAP